MEIKVKVCIGTPCHLMGAQSLIETLKRLNQKIDINIDIEAVNCLKRCKAAPAVEVEGEVYAPSAPKELIDIIKNKL